jgi:hypothetical protein
MSIKRSSQRISFLLLFFFVNSNLCLAQPKPPLEVVRLFEKHYSGPLMDEIADLTTPRFRDNKPKAVWIVETWKTLNKIKYEKLNSSVIDSKVEGDKAIVVLKAKITTAGSGEVSHKEVYYLVKEGGTWLIDDLIVTDEEIDLEKMEL